MLSRPYFNLGYQPSLSDKSQGLSYTLQTGWLCVCCGGCSWNFLTFVHPSRGFHLLIMLLSPSLLKSPKASVSPRLRDVVVTLSPQVKSLLSLNLGASLILSAPVPFPSGIQLEGLRSWQLGSPTFPSTAPRPLRCSTCC